MKSIKLIRHLLESKKDLEEISTTAGTPGYNVPGAFTGNKPKAEKRRKKNAEVYGYVLTGKSDTKEGVTEQKVRRAIRKLVHEVKQQKQSENTQALYPTPAVASNIANHLENIETEARALRDACKIYASDELRNKVGEAVKDLSTLVEKFKALSKSLPEYNIEPESKK